MDITYDKKIIAVNSVFMVIEGALFNTALSLIPNETVIASFMDTLTGSTTLAGLAATLSSLMYYIGQFISGLFIHKIKRQLPFQRTMAFISRFTLMLYAFSLFFIKGNAAAWLFIIAYTIIFILDGAVGLCWNACMVRTLPVKMRGPVFSYQQSLCGILGILTGFVTQRVLIMDLDQMTRFRILFFASAAIFLVSAAMMFFFKDVKHASSPETPVKSPIKYLKELLPMFVTEKEMRCTIIARALFVMTVISMPVNFKFGQTHGLDEYQLSLLVWMPIAGQIISGFFWSYLSKKTSYPFIMFVSMLFGVLCAVLNFVSLFMGTAGLPVFIPLAAAMFFIKFTYATNGIYATHAVATVDPSLTESAIVLCSLISAPMTLGNTLAGIIANYSFWPIYAIMLVCGIIGTIYVKRVFDIKLKPAK